MVDNFMTQGRAGRFRIHRMFFETRDSEKLLRFFGNFVVVRAELLYTEDCVEYTAYSPLFELVDRGDLIPLYEVTHDIDGKIVARKRDSWVQAGYE